MPILAHTRVRSAGRSGAVVLPVLLVLLVLGSLSAGTSAADPRPFLWPLEPRPVVVTAFAPPPERWLPGHRGLDLDGGPTPGPTVLAAGDGVVVFAGVVAGRGVVSLDHGDVRTTYEPVRPLVSRGARVRGGQPIAVLEEGHPSCPVARCLHWGARRGDTYVDPASLLRAGPIRLKPTARR